jgi:hypothetical protein
VLTCEQILLKGRIAPSPGLCTGRATPSQRTTPANPSHADCRAAIRASSSKTKVGPKYELLPRHVLNLLQKTLPPEVTKLLAILVTAEIPSPGSRGIVWVCEGLATAAVATLAILAGAARGPLLRLPTLAFLGRISYPQSRSGRPLRDGRGGGGSRGLSRLAIGGIPDWCRHRYHGRRVRGLSCRQRTAYVSLRAWHRVPAAIARLPMRRVFFWTFVTA